MWIMQGAGPETEVITFRFSSGSVKTIGRASRADFIVDAALVSRLHCRIEAGDADIEVVDLSSTNGTYINDKKIDRARMAPGDRLRVGRVELTVERQAD